VSRHEIWDRSKLTRSDDLKNFNDLQKKYDGPTYRVISLVLKAMTDKKITPPSQNYRKCVRLVPHLEAC